MDKIKENNLVSKDSPYFNSLMAAKIKIGKNNVFESGVELETQGGEIEIGNSNIFEAMVRIVNPSPTEKMIIGNFNHFEPRVTINTCSINNLNIFKMYSSAIGCLIKDNCVIAMCSAVTGTILDYQVYSDLMGAAPNYMAQENATVYMNNMTNAYKKIVEAKMKNRLKIKEQEVKKAQATSAKQPQGS